MSSEEQKLSGVKTEKREIVATPEQGADVPNSPEQAVQESKREVGSFLSDGGAQLREIEARADMAGVIVDVVDRDAIQSIEKEAGIAQDKLHIDLDEEVYQGFAKSRKAIWEGAGTSVVEAAESERKRTQMEAESAAQLVERYTQRTEKLRADVEEKKSSLIGRVLHFREIRTLERDVNATQRVLEIAEKRQREVRELYAAYDRILEEQKELDALIEEARGEKNEWYAKRTQEEEDGRSVSKLAAKHGEFFVHDLITADWKPSGNNAAIDTKKLGLLDQLDIVHGLDPTIAASTLKSGNAQHRTFGDGAWGVLLSGGRVLGGLPQDASSIAYGLRDRRFTGGARAKTIEGIDAAINKHNASYNELIVENPEVAGVYVKWNSERPPLVEDTDIVLSEVGSRGVDSYATWWESIASVIQRGVPLFIINRENNTVRMMYDISVARKSFKVSSEYRPQDVAKMPGIYRQHLGSDEKRKAAMRVFDKAVGVIPPDERERYAPDGTEQDGRGFYNVH